MNSADQITLKEFAQRIRGRFPNARIWAFGSRVREDGDLESDLDVCVVVSGLDHDAKAYIRRAAWEVGYTHGVVISTIKYSEQTFSGKVCGSSPLVQAILREGLAA